MTSFMKTILPLSAAWMALVCVIPTAVADTVEIGGRYGLTATAQIVECTGAFRTTEQTPRLVQDLAEDDAAWEDSPPTPSEFRVTDISDSGIARIEFLHWSNSDNTDRTPVSVQAMELETRYRMGDAGTASVPTQFCVLRGHLEERAFVRHNRGAASFHVGPIVVPLRVRPGNGNDREFDLETDVAVDAAFAVEFQLGKRRNIRLGMVAVAGITSVDIDQSNSSLTEPVDRAAFSTGGGVIADLAGAQLALLCGVDLINDNGTTNWTYQGQPWIGIAIGTSIFSGKDTQRAEPNQ